MKRIVLIGYGRMGQMIHECLTGDPQLEFAGIAGCEGYQDFLEFPGEVDAAIDFSWAGGLEGTLKGAIAKNCALVLGTTGYTEADRQKIAEASARIPIVQSANYSIGVAVLKKALAVAAGQLLGDFDCEIIETHHNQKADAPSGTALALRDAIDPEKKRESVYGRCGMTGKRGSEIGIHAVRGGTVPGTHEVHFFGQDEELEFTHRAQSRKIFAVGAIRAAKAILGKKPGLYTFEQLLFGEDDCER